MCSLTKPVVDRLERDLAGRADVQRIDIISPLGRQLAREHGVTLIPALLLFDSAGNLWRRQLGSLDPEAIQQTMAQMEKTHGQA